MMLENLLNKYEEDRRLTNEQLNDTIKQLEHEELRSSQESLPGHPSGPQVMLETELDE